MFLIVIIIIIVLILLWFYRYRYSPDNTSKIAACDTCKEYNVHREHFNKQDAAKLMGNIEINVNTLLDYLKSTYDPDIRPFDKNHANRIDVITAVPDTNDEGNVKDWNEKMQERVLQLLQNYNPHDIYEISPLNQDGLTSYTESKRTLVLCLRHKIPDNNGNYELHDINTMMFVVLHELSHMMNDEWGHPSGFWKLFKFMLVSGVQCGVYKPVDYAKSPIVYCGLPITYNPYFDKRI